MIDFKKEFVLNDGMKLILRTAKIGDEKDLLDQMKRADCETKFLAREDGELEEILKHQNDFITNMINGTNSLLMVAEIDGRIVGNCAVRFVSKNLRYLHRASLGFTISKEYWGNGIGSKMITECINFCKYEGFEQLELEVVTGNTRAISLYEKFGFNIYTTLKRSMKYLDGTYADEHIMILFLNNEI